jgi:hypothetical protein
MMLSARFQVLIIVKIQVEVFRVVILSSVAVDTNILEDPAASIFKMKRMGLGKGA